MKYYLGVDLGGTNIAAGVVDENYNVVTRKSLSAGAMRPAGEVMRDVVCAAKAAAEQAGLSLRDFSSLGIGIPCGIHPETGRTVGNNNFVWDDLPIESVLKEYTELPIVLENDANCAVLGEALAGAARQCQNVVMLTLGTGVGGGLLIDGKIYAGADGLGAELGHMKLVFKGELCTCGQRGCVEAYSSATALSRQAERLMKKRRDSLLWELCAGNPGKVDGRMVFEAFRQDDEAAGEAVNRYIDYLVAAISSFVAIFRPEIVILGGGIAEAEEALIKPVNERLAANTYAGTEMGVPRVVKAALGNDAGIIGAAFLERYGSRYLRK